MIKTNQKQLVCQSVIGEISSPLVGASPYRIDPDGKSDIYPGVGGITYNLRVGDPACGWFADHVEPGVSISNFTKYQGQAGPNRALNIFSCVGNEAIVVSGEAKGEKGRVIGKHGGIEHVLVEFAAEANEKLVIGDKIQIKAKGCGLRLLDYPGVRVMNIDPELFSRLPIKRSKKGRLRVPVSHTVPAAIMGSGLGSTHSHSGDYDIQLFDKPTVSKYKLDTLKIGDFVAIMDAEAGFGRIYRQGGIVIGLIVHSDCVIAGHGPGLMVLMSAGDGSIEPSMSSGANLKKYL